MRVLLDTNILIHREAATVVRGDIGIFFRWLDRLKYEKWIHPVSVAEIQQHQDERVRCSFEAKLKSYCQIQIPADLAPEVQELDDQLDSTPNSRNDTCILNELYMNRVDILITEDRGIARKAVRLCIDDRVFTIDGFLEKVIAENPELMDYKDLSVKKIYFGELDVSDEFFDSFRQDYPGFNDWFNRKSQEMAYVCRKGEKIVAFLYLKVEDEKEPYANIDPHFLPKKRLKIGTFKVKMNGFKLGERFLKIIFDNAIRQRVSEVYATIFKCNVGQERLINLLEDYGFTRHGQKMNDYGNEQVYVRDMTPQFDNARPRLTFPFVNQSARHFLVPIYPDYHTELLPDSILNTESPESFVEQKPHRNAISKVYISRSYFRNLHPGDIIIFYRTGGLHKSVVTTLGIVENLHVDINSEEEFIRLCRQRSVFTDAELREQWNYRWNNRPFVVNFLYAYSFPKRPNMSALIDNGVIKNVDSAPRGFERITNEQFETIIRLSKTDPRIIVN